MVRLKYWQQDTTESGHWELSGLMTRKTAIKIVSSGIYEQAEIVEDSEYV